MLNSERDFNRFLKEKLDGALTTRSGKLFQTRVQLMKKDD